MKSTHVIVEGGSRQEQSNMAPSLCYLVRGTADRDEQNGTEGGLQAQNLYLENGTNETQLSSQ